jgi:hypothetical protein
MRNTQSIHSHRALACPEFSREAATLPNEVQDKSPLKGGMKYLGWPLG